MKKKKKIKKKKIQPVIRENLREIIPVGILEQIMQMILLKNERNIIPTTDGDRCGIFESREKKLKSINDFIKANFKYDISLLNQIEELNGMDLDFFPKDMEPLCICLAEFNVKNIDSFIQKLYELEDFQLEEEYKDGIDFVWTRPYPKEHLNPNSEIPGASQFLAKLTIYNNGTLICFAKSRGWMSRLMFVLYKMLNQNIELKKLSFKDI